MTSSHGSAEHTSRPLHIQVRETIRRQVKAGKLIDESGRLMTEAELGKHFGTDSGLPSRPGPKFVIAVSRSSVASG